MKTCIKERPIAFSADMVRALLQGWTDQPHAGLRTFQWLAGLENPPGGRCLGTMSFYKRRAGHLARRFPGSARGMPAWAGSCGEMPLWEAGGTAMGAGTLESRVVPAMGRL